MASRLALVTGGNKGIGFSICKQLLRANFRVLLASRNIENGANAISQLELELPEFAKNVDLLELDVSSAPSIASSFDYLRNEKRISSIDVLINNAGIASDDVFNSQIVDSVFQTNFFGAIDMTQTYLPMLTQKANDTPSKILMMSSRVGSITKLPSEEHRALLNSEELTYSGLQTMMSKCTSDVRSLQETCADENGNLSKEVVSEKGWWNSAYGMSKLGLSQYSRVLARDIGDSCFVASYCPGFVRTDMTSNYGKNIPLGPDDGAKGMVMLANAKDGEYENGKFWCLDNDQQLAKVDWYNCRIPRKKRNP